MPATNTSSTPKTNYAVLGKNYAPSAPLKALESRKPNWSPDELTSALKKKYDDYIKRDYEAWIELVEQGRMVANLTLGKLLPLRNRVSGRWMMIAKTDSRFADNKTVAGQFQFYITKLNSEWLSSNPELDPICPSDADQIEQYISAVKMVNDFYEQKFYDVAYQTNEFKSAAEYGTWLTRYRYDPDIKDLVCELLPFPACRWDLRKRAEESSYFIYQSKCSTAVLANLLNADIASDSNEDYDNPGLRIIDQISRQGGSVTGEGKTNPYGNYDNVDGENVVTEMWLQPEAYCDIELTMPEDSVDGGKIPKKLIDMFPNGLCAVGINGMKTIIQLHSENLKDHIVSGLYHVQSFCGVGKGVSDAVDAYKDLNDLHSQLLAHTKAHSMPGFGYNSKVVDENDARSIGQPRKNIALNFDNAPDGIHSVNQVIEAIVPGAASPAAFQMVESFKNDLQIAFQTTQFSGAFPGVDNTTATGAKIGDAEASSVLIPQHLNKADHRKRSAVVVYNLFRKYMPAQKWFPMKNINGITKGMTFDNTKFADVEIEFQIVPNSQISQSPYQQRENLSQLFQFTGGLPGLLQAQQMNPDITSTVIDAYGVKLPIAMKDNVARICRRRIEWCQKKLQEEMMLQRVMPQGTQIDNYNLAEAIVSQMPDHISPSELYGKEKAAWMADLLDTDELQYGPPEMRLIVEELIRKQLQIETFGQAERDMDTNIGMVMGQLPQVLGTQMMSNQATQMQQQYEAQQAQAQAQQEQQNQLQQGALQIAQQSAQAKIADQQAQSQHRNALAQSAQQHAIQTAQNNQAHQQTLIQQQNQAGLDQQAQQQSAGIDAGQMAMQHAQEATQQQNQQDHDLQTQALGHLAAIAAAKAKPKPTGATK